MITQTSCTVFAQNLLKGLENFNTGTSYTYKIALYTANATLNNTTASYTTINEVSGAGYTAGGNTLTISTVPTGDTTNNIAFISFAPVNWYGASFTTRGALIYNATTSAAVCVLNFGSDKSPSGNTFTITFPSATSTSAIITVS
jgi:hypothetical protein